MKKRRSKIRVAMVAPVFGDTGGPEVMVQNLTNGLLKKGVDVTLFAPADWRTKAKHIPTLQKSLRRRNDFSQLTKIAIRAYCNASQIKVLNYQDKFDIVHLHLQSHAYAVCSNTKNPCVLSFHSPITNPYFQMLKRAGVFTVALSKHQKGKNRTSALIYNGVPISEIKPSFEHGSYLVSIGRLHPQKGIDRAIQIALRAKKKLLIFGRIGFSEKRQSYYKSKIAPFVDGKQIILMKEVSNKQIFEYIRNAEALLFPIRRPEICPMSVAESLACGTPVIGTKTAPLEKLLQNKKTAFLSDNIRSLVSATINTQQFNRRKCRKYAEMHFDSDTMAEKYIELYEKILKKI